MLNGWLQKADKIRLSRPGSLKSGRSGRRPQFPDIEKQLYELFSHEVDKGNKVGNRWIRDMARMLAKQQCSRQELDGMCQFSERWLSNFKKRYKINLSKDNDTTSGGDSSCSASSHHDYEDSSMEKVAEHEKHNETLIMTNELDETESEHDSENGIESMLEEANKTRPNSRQLVQEILNQPGELPIQAFYKRFPWLCKRTQPQKEKGSEPNRRGRKVQFPEVERLLHERVLARIAQNGRVSNKWLQQNAKEIAKLLDPSFKISSRFQFSDHWLHNFKKRYGLTLKATKQEKTPETKQENLSSSAFPQGWPGNEMLQVYLKRYFVT
uniref:HTH CENPB-type domain-containing protein n=1 Tax=Acrobeloides nanus TaxID=290746 RepID=A0A914CNQ7_9BILA